MFQVVVLPPADALREVEEFRRLHDPAFHRVGAHLPLLAPFPAKDAALIERFDAFRGGGAFEVTFGPPTSNGHSLHLPPAGGAAELRALQEAVETWIHGAACAQSPAAVLRIGLFGSAAELELARRAVASQPATAGFEVREITLLLEDVRGLWHAVRTRRL